MTYTDNELRAAFSKSVYIHAVGGPLTHNAGCLIEGLLDLGIPVKVSTAEVTSRPASMPLKNVDLTPYLAPPYAGLSGYIIDISHTNAFIPFDGTGDGRLAYLNQSDIGVFCRIPDEHLLFTTHDNRYAHKGGTRQPIAFGISKGLIEATKSRPAFNTRKRKALRNFRATLSQSVRALLDMSFVPRLEKHMPVDREIYTAGPYVDQMLGSTICLAYGGDFYAPIAENPWFKKNDPQLAELHDFTRLDAPAFVQRWDSFRLWESFASECLTVHLDFEKYGFALPEMPRAWEHYAPITLDNIEDSVTEIMDREKEWGEIAARGRAWAIEHYAPKPTTARALSAMLAQPGTIA